MTGIRGDAISLYTGRSSVDFVDRRRGMDCFAYRLTGLILAAALIAGCDKQGSSGDAGGRGAAGASAPPARVRIGYFANLTHAQAVLGVASGEFRQAVAPAEVTINVFNAGPSLVEALFAGEIDIGY